MGESLEAGDLCEFEVSMDGGAAWTQLISVGDAPPEGSFVTVSNVAVANPAVGVATLTMRLRQEANGNKDFCDLKDASVVAF
jgi:hypothetical protein